MAKRLQMYKVRQIRNEYFLYVYKKHIYNIFNNHDISKDEQIYQGRMKHYDNPEILKDYLNSKSFSRSKVN